jgi:hypothetical protein
MKVINEDFNLENFQAWSGAIETQKAIIEQGLSDEFENLLNELYPDGLTETQINDILWFEEDFLKENIGLKIEE